MAERNNPMTQPVGLRKKQEIYKRFRPTTKNCEEEKPKTTQNSMAYKSGYWQVTKLTVILGDRQRKPKLLCTQKP